MAYKAIVYRIYPDKEQNIQCKKTFGCCRFVYNRMLTVQQDRYKNGEKHLSKTGANNYCNQTLKPDYPFLREVDKFALTNVIYHLEDGYARFFKRLSKFPKYKSKHRSKKSYTTNFTNGNIEVGDGYVKLPKLGRVKAKTHRLPGEGWKIRSATVTQNRDDTFQVSVLFECGEEARDAPITEASTVGLDYKSDGLYVSSDGKTCGMPHFFRRSADRLAKAQRKLKHKTIGSHNYNRQQKKVAKVHRHIANQRKDFLHKESTAIAKQYSCVCVEDLNMKAMSNRGFGNGKATMDNGYGMFLGMLEYKLRDRGGRLVKVDRFYPSSQLCSCCGFQNPALKDLSIRRWDCPNCGTANIDRDINAAKNIRQEGLRLLTA